MSGPKRELTDVSSISSYPPPLRWESVGPSPPRLRLLTASGITPEAFARGPARVRRRPRAVRPALVRASSARRASVTLHPRHADVAPARALAAPCEALPVWY